MPASERGRSPLRATNSSRKCSRQTAVGRLSAACAVSAISGILWRWIVGTTEVRPNGWGGAGSRGDQYPPPPAGPPSDKPPRSADQGAGFVRQLQVFRQRLLSTDACSPTIFLGKCGRSRHLDISSVRATATSLLSKCSTPQATIPLVLDREESAEAAALRAALVPLQRTVLACAEDTGVEALHVGACWVEGLLEPEVYVRAPLILLPCALRQQSRGRNAGWHLAFESDGVLLNSALLALIKICRRYQLPTDFEERLTELCAATKEETEATTSVLGALAELRFPATGSLLPPRPLTALTKRVALTRPDLHSFRLVPYTVLGLFEVSSTTLHADLGMMVERAIAGETDQGIVDNLLDTPADDPSTNEANLAAPVALDDVPDAHLNLVVPSDPSQEAVILRAERADCVVVRGPPGTGKSQVIVNLVANALSRNQRVAVVCQKRVALDVVRDRMATVGLGDAAFLVHDPQADLKALYRQIATRMDASGAEPPREAELVTRLATDIDGGVRELRDLIGALAAPAHGIPVSALYARATPQLRPVLDVLESLTNLTFDQLPQALRAIRDAQASRRREHQLRGSRAAHPLGAREGAVGRAPESSRGAGCCRHSSAGDHRQRARAPERRHHHDESAAGGGGAGGGQAPAGDRSAIRSAVSYGRAAPEPGRASGHQEHRERSG